MDRWTPVLLPLALALLYRVETSGYRFLVPIGLIGPEDWGKLNMMRRSLLALLGAVIVLAGTTTWAAEDDKRIVNGPSKSSFGGFQLVLGQGASAEVQYQPDASKINVKTLVGEARIITSAKNLILVESDEGRVEILLPNGRVVVVEPGKAEIVGRTLGEDPGNITIRLSGTGPIAQAGNGNPGITNSAVQITLLDSTENAQGQNQDNQDTPPGPRNSPSNSVSPSTP